MRAKIRAHFSDGPEVLLLGELPLSTHRTLSRAVGQMLLPAKGRVRRVRCTVHRPLRNSGNLHRKLYRDEVTVAPRGMDVVMLLRDAVLGRLAVGGTR